MGNNKATVVVSKPKTIFNPYVKENACQETVKGINGKGMLNAPALFAETQEIKVTANSEGYILIDLRIRWRRQKR